MRTYAETADLPPAVATALGDSVQSFIAEASLLVEEATVADRYQVDDDGYPTEATIVTAFRDATVAQVAYWQASKVNPVGGVLAQAPEVTSQSAPAGGSISYGSLRTQEALTAALGGLCDSAARILRLAGLTAGNAVPGQV
ncbi:hypothetical protein K8O93_01155 [Gordonia bronchialis]|uniref:hypothetical protein n=1 Tax=Gordonia bronchialis TaxID=2054 RepID=UPI001CBAF03D|nr:hypothetical protein [Gordonia bronchialis]UAK38442.1 hypothetical protein K8O93_01155 [Gordonia bronchialis]